MAGYHSGAVENGKEMHFLLACQDWRGIKGFLNFEAAPHARNIAMWWRPEKPLILATEM